MTHRGIEFPVEGLFDGDLHLRVMTEADIPAVAEACRDPEVARWTRVPDDYTEQDARGWLRQEAEGRSRGELLGVLVVDARGGPLLGSVGLVRADWEEARCEVGYWMARESRRRGIGTRAVRALCEWTFENLPFDRLEIHVEPENRASRGLAEAVGFAFEGVLRSYFVNKGIRRDACSYSLLRGELR